MTYYIHHQLIDSYKTARFRLLGYSEYVGITCIDYAHPKVATNLDKPIFGIEHSGQAVGS